LQFSCDWLFAYHYTFDSRKGAMLDRSIAVGRNSYQERLIVKSIDLLRKKRRPLARRGVRFGFLVMALIGLATLAFSYRQDEVTPAPRPRSKGAQSTVRTITPIPFGVMNGDDVYNASGVVPLADSRFLFCDNNSNDALFELNLTADGHMDGPLIRRPLQGIPPGAVNDLESMTIAREKGHRYIFVASSLSVKITKGEGSKRVPLNGLLRVRVNHNGSLSAENMPDFRDWFVRHAPDIGASATLVPDEGGLNIEGLAWDDRRHALLFGLRTPLGTGGPLLIPVRIKNLAGPWTTGNLEMLAPIRLALDGKDGAQGIRSIEYIAKLHSFLVIVGKAISKSKVPFALYEWDGDDQGRMRRIDVTFAEKMKPEGITGGKVGGKPALLFLDDGGGYQVLWLHKAGL